MRVSIDIDRPDYERVRAHLLGGPLEDAAFLFADEVPDAGSLRLRVCGVHLVPPDAWRVRSVDALELSDDERARLLREARSRRATLIDCHSHPRVDGPVAFSAFDYASILEFLPYVRWKLGRVTFVATVWSPKSIDAVAFVGCEDAVAVADVNVGDTHLRPRHTWSAKWRRP